MKRVHADLFTDSLKQCELYTCTFSCHSRNASGSTYHGSTTLVTFLAIYNTLVSVKVIIDRNVSLTK